VDRRKDERNGVSVIGWESVVVVVVVDPSKWHRLKVNQKTEDASFMGCANISKAGVYYSVSSAFTM